MNVLKIQLTLEIDPAEGEADEDTLGWKIEEMINGLGDDAAQAGLRDLRDLKKLFSEHTYRIDWVNLQEKRAKVTIQYHDPRDTITTVVGDPSRSCVPDSQGTCSKLGCPNHATWRKAP